VSEKPIQNGSQLTLLITKKKPQKAHTRKIGIQWTSWQLLPYFQQDTTHHEFLALTQHTQVYEQLKNKCKKNTFGYQWMLWDGHSQAFAQLVVATPEPWGLSTQDLLSLLLVPTATIQIHFKRQKNGKSWLPKIRMVVIHCTNIWDFWPQQMEIFLLFVISVKTWGNYQLDLVGLLIENYDGFGGGVGHRVFCLLIESRLESTDDGTSTFYSFSHFWWLSKLHKTQFTSIIH
jgi:hypothetical protein